jgi:xanthine dehydrogenase large subunit
MGGGFGGKEMQPHGFAAIAALGATLTGRPVRLRLTRTQDLTMSGKRHGFHADWRVGFYENGRLQALDATLTADGGWSLDLSEPVLARALCHIDNAYWIPNVRVNGRIAKTNKTSQTAFRGFGGPQGMLVIEDILGKLARPPRTANRFGTLSGSPRSGSRCSTAPTSYGGRTRSPNTTAPTSTSNGHWP